MYRTTGAGGSTAQSSVWRPMPIAPLPNPAPNVYQFQTTTPRNFSNFTIVRDDNDVSVRTNEAGAFEEYIQTALMKESISWRSDQPMSYDLIAGAFASLGAEADPNAPPLTDDISRPIERPWMPTKSWTTLSSAATFNDLPVHVGYKLYNHNPFLGQIDWPSWLFGGAPAHFYQTPGVFRFTYFFQFRVRDTRAIISNPSLMLGDAQGLAISQSQRVFNNDSGKIVRALKNGLIKNSRHLWTGEYQARKRQRTVVKDEEEMEETPPKIDLPLEVVEES